MPAPRRHPEPNAQPRNTFGKRPKPSARLDFLFDARPPVVPVPVPVVAPAPAPAAPLEPRRLGWKGEPFDLAAVFLPRPVVPISAAASRLFLALYSRLIRSGS